MGAQALLAPVAMAVAAAAALRSATVGPAGEGGGGARSEPPPPPPPQLAKASARTTPRDAEWRHWRRVATSEKTAIPGLASVRVSGASD